MSYPPCPTFMATQEQMLEIVDIAAEIGGICPTDEYLAKHAGPNDRFLLFPVRQILEDVAVFGVIGVDPILDRDGFVAEYASDIPDVNNLGEFLAAVDSESRQQATGRRDRTLVWCEVPLAMLPTLEETGEAPKDVVKKIRSKGYDYLIRNLSKDATVIEKLTREARMYR